MNRLCGWLGAGLSGMPPALALDAMAAGLPGPGEARGRVADDASALHAAAMPGRAAVAEEGAVRAAIEGRPRWSDDRLAAIARDRGPAAALVEAWRRDGEGLFRHLAGPFALAVIDGGRALAAIDRFGVHTLSYATPPSGGIVFGSTTDAVAAHPAVTATVSPQALYGYLLFFTVRAPETIYAEQRKLRPGEYVVAGPDGVRTGFHWRPAYRPERADPRALAEELDRLLRQAVARSIEGEDPAQTGAFLSGGLDSSTVAGMLGAVTGRAPRAFTIGFDGDRYDERPFARIAARHFGAEHHEHVLAADEAADLVPKVAAAFDEPFGNSSALPAFACAREARDAGVTLMLAGDGGDEIFAGNKRYMEQLKFELYGRLPAALRRLVLEPALLNGEALGAAIARLPVLSKARRYVRQAAVPLPDRLEAYNFAYALPASALLAPGTLALVDEAAPRRRMREAFAAADGADVVHRMLALDLHTTLADNDLRKVGRMCALAGMPLAYPLLDEDLFDFAARIPPGLQVTPSRLRLAFKDAMAGFLPPQIVAKEKHGFGMPFGEWTHGHPRLRDMADAALTSFAGRGYIDPAFMTAMIESHRNGGTGPHGSVVWDVMMLELWLGGRSSN